MCVQVLAAVTARSTDSSVNDWARISLSVLVKRISGEGDVKEDVKGDVKA